MNPLVFSGYVRALFMSVGFAYPVRYVCCFGLSTLIYLLVSGLSIDYPHATIMKTISDNPKSFVFSLSTVIAFWPSLLSRNLRPDRMSALIDTVSEIIDRAKLPPAQRNMVWKRLADKIVDQTKPDDPLNSAEIERLARDSAKELQDNNEDDPMLPT